MPWYEPPFNSAQRSSTLNQSRPARWIGNSRLFPLPGGPATTSAVGRRAVAKAGDQSVVTSVLESGAHVGRQLVRHELPLLVDDAELAQAVALLEHAREALFESPRLPLGELLLVRGVGVGQGVGPGRLERLLRHIRLCLQATPRARREQRRRSLAAAARATALRPSTRRSRARLPA